MQVKYYYTKLNKTEVQYSIGGKASQWYRILLILVPSSFDCFGPVLTVTWIYQIYYEYVISKLQEVNNHIKLMSSDIEHFNPRLISVYSWGSFYFQSSGESISDFLPLERSGCSKNVSVRDENAIGGVGTNEDQDHPRELRRGQLRASEQAESWVRPPAYCNIPVY